MAFSEKKLAFFVISYNTHGKISHHSKSTLLVDVDADIGVERGGLETFLSRPHGNN